jgi:HSP20 family protein
MKLTRRNFKRDEPNHKPEWIETGFNLPAMFDDFFTRDFRTSFGNSGVSTPAVNIIETNDDFRLEMVAPGMKKEAFNVELQENVLTISYEHEDNREGERREWKYTTREYNYHSFTRSFLLPDSADTGKIEAKYQDGILNLIIPKKDEARGKPGRQIKIS